MPDVHTLPTLPTPAARDRRGLLRRPLISGQMRQPALRL